MEDIERCLRVLRGDAPLEERLAAGERLAELGDPRVGRSDLVDIPAGEFVMGTRDGGEKPHESPARTVFVGAFRIERLPVTVGAYARFVAAGGYRDAALWSDAGWRWREATGTEAPRFWGEHAAWGTYLVANHPVVGVSFWEAEAYARWRGMRLPTEAQWEKAARGTDGRLYPWGDAWQDDACAGRAIGPRHTVSVGCFPRGRSPWGVLDLVGCVWQWCLDGYDAEAYQHTDARDPCAPWREGAQRVTRGGAWNTLRWSLRCANRNAFPPGARFSNLGFRCVEG